MNTILKTSVLLTLVSTVLFIAAENGSTKTKETDSRYVLINPADNPQRSKRIRIENWRKIGRYLQEKAAAKAAGKEHEVPSLKWAD